jgi:hypothetical protein
MLWLDPVEKNYTDLQEKRETPAWRGRFPEYGVLAGNASDVRLACPRLHGGSARLVSDVSPRRRSGGSNI